MPPYKTKNILGVSVANVTLFTIASIIQKLMISSGKKTFYGANPHSINLYQTNMEFKKAMDKATFIYPEGIGTVIASRILGISLKEKTNLLDFIPSLLDFTDKQKWPVFILGGTPDISNKAKYNLQNKYTKLKVYNYHGYFTEQENSKVIKLINLRKPKILFVAMGSPKQEVWINNNIDSLEVKSFFGIGGSIDIIAGKLPRAPFLIRQSGLEWLYRIYKEPSRLWKRYTIDNAVFMIRVFAKVLGS